MLSLRRITKSFGATCALGGVDFDAAAGQIVGLVGQNGAGKTTLMRVAAGELVPDSGEVVISGSLALVHQHFQLVENFTVAENLALSGNLHPVRTRDGGLNPATPLAMFHFTSKRVVEQEAARAIAESGIALPSPGRRIGDLSVGEKSKLELVKALRKNPSVLILDEPTAVLTPLETEELFTVIKRLAASSVAVVLISHKLPEVLSIAERIVVMREGNVVLETSAAHTHAAALATAMVGTLRGAPTSRRRVEASGENVLRCDSLHSSRLNGLTFEVKKNEIVVIAGVAGNGQDELLEILRGHRHPAAARIEVKAQRVAFIPADRTRDGIVAAMSIAENIALGGRWNRAEATRRARELIASYSIRASAPEQRAGTLSGGNQQKVLLARELSRNPDLIVAAEPTRGLDLEATQFVHEQLLAAAARGAAILLITSDLEEAFTIGTVFHVIHRGRLSNRMTREEAEVRVAPLMAGMA